jgi:hypothetical protein
MVITMLFIGVGMVSTVQPKFLTLTRISHKSQVHRGSE